MNYIYSDVLKIPSEISDHDASVSFLQCPKSVSVSFKREVWLYDKVDKQKFIEKLEIVDWITLLCQFDDVDDMCNQFTKTFLELAGECIPTKRVIVRYNDKLWFTSEIRKEIRIRDRLRKVILKYHRNSDICKYNKQRNRINNFKKIAKENFEINLDNIILENASNNKTYWKIMKMFLKSNKGYGNFPPLQNIINNKNLEEFAYDDEEKCDLLNKYFSFISKLDEANAPLPDIELKTNNNITDINVSIQEISDIIQILHPNKASGPDVISHKMLKLCPNNIALPLQIIFNKSLHQSKYPTNWKLAHVIAVFKKGDSSLPSNYRPTSLINCVGKIMERVIYKHVYNYLHQNKLIYEYQSGFPPKHSTVHQLLEIYNSILNSLKKKEANCFVFCDLSKAFDKVWHRGLLHKMKAYGITGNLINWLKSYLKARRQKLLLKIILQHIVKYLQVFHNDLSLPLFYLISI